MANTTDRIAIIRAISEASDAELEALAKIHEAITDHLSPADAGNRASARTRSGDQDPSVKTEGKVRRRLSRTPGESQKDDNRPPERPSGRNPYVDRMNPRSDKDNRVSDGTGVFQAGAHRQASAPGEGVKLARPRKNASATGGIGTQKAGERDSKGRFLSKDKQEDIRQRRAQQKQLSDEAELQEGFFRRLGSLVGLDGEEHRPEDDGLTNAAGVGAGGVLWTAASGILDIAKDSTNKVISMKQWVDERLSSDEDDSQQREPQPAKKADPIRYPDAEAKPVIAPPVLGARQSAEVFADKNAVESVKAVEAQTETLAKNDGKIIDTLEDVEDEIVKLRKIMKNALGGGGLGGLFGRRGRVGLGRNGRNGRNTGRNTGNKKTPGGKTKPGTPKTKTPVPKNTPKPKAPGKIGKIAQAIGGKGAAIAAGTVVTAGAAAATKAAMTKGAPDAAAKATIRKGAAEAAEHAVTGAGAKTAQVATEAVKTQQAATGAAEKALAAKTEAKATEKAATAGAEKAVTAAAEPAAAKATAATAEKAASTTAIKGTEKLGVKAALKTGLRFLPVVGTGIMAGIDAVDGYNDEEGQRAAFAVDEGTEITGQQQSAYTTANVLDLGGLVSGASNLLGMGASAVGLEKAGTAMQAFDTGTIARAVDSGFDTAKNVASSITDFASSAFATVTDFTSSAFSDTADKIKSGFASTDDSTKQVKASVEDGTRKTVAAINELKGQLQGGREGEDGVGQYGKTVADYAAPGANVIGTDLNIGGKNAQNRNFRNNNIGNLVFANQEGASLEKPNAAGEQRFGYYNTPEEGIRALGNQVGSYYQGTSKAAGYKKLQTVSEIISKWAPPNENNTNEYIESASKYLGVSPHEKIDVTDPQVMTHLVRAIATKEGGNPTVTDDYIKNSLGTFNSQTGKWEGQFSDESLASVNAARASRGEAAISRDSQYSTGNKVRLAEGEAKPVTPPAPALPLMEMAVNDEAIAQKAQATKHPKPADVPPPAAAAAQAPEPNINAGNIASAAAVPATVLAASSAGAIDSAVAKSREMDQGVSKQINNLTGKQPGFKPVPAVTASGHSKPAAVSPASNMAKAGAPTAEMVAAAAIPAGEDKENDAESAGSLGGFMASLASSSLGAATDLLSIGTPEGLEKALNNARELDKGIGAKVHGLTGKKFGFTQAKKIGAVEDAAARGRASMTAAGSSQPDVDLLGGMGLPTAEGNETGSDVTVYDNGYRIVDEKEGGFFSSMADAAGSGARRIGSAILPVLGNKAGGMLENMTGGTIANDLVDRLAGGNTNIARAVSPLTRKAGSMLDSGIQQSAEAVRSSANTMNEGIFGTPHARQEPFLSMPSQLPTVTDLAGSGIRQSLASDVVNSDPKMQATLESINTTLRELLGVSKLGTKGDADKVVKTAQPEPRQRATTTISDPSLDALLGD